MGSSSASAAERLGRGAVVALLLAASAAHAESRRVPAPAAPAVAPPAPGTASPPAGPAAPPQAAPAAAPHAGDLPSLLAGMRSATGVVAKFTETKELALLSAPLESTGTIYFVPPDRLVRVVTSPGRSRLVVDGDKVRFEDETGTKALDMSGSPVARQLVDSFVVLFNGDEKRLHELYDATFSAEGAQWKLRLVPKRMPLSRMIASFDLTGSGARIDRMDAVEPDGDRTVTRFGETDVHHRFEERELAELFGAPATP